MGENKPLVGQKARVLVTEVRCIGMTVSDLERSTDFYARVLGFERLGEASESESAPLEKQDFLSRGRQPVHERSAACPGSDHDDVVGIGHASLRLSPS